MAASQRNYQVKNKSLLLTYANLQEYYPTREACLLSAKTFFSACKTANREPAFVSIAVENYSDRPDDFHVHVLLTWLISLTHTIDHYKWHSIAPNSKRVSSSTKTNLAQITYYFEKDGCFDIGHAAPGASTQQDLWARALTCDTRAEAASFIQTNFPKQYVLNNTSVNAFLNSHYRGTNKAYEPPTDLQPFSNVPQEALDWVRDEFSKVCYTLSLIFPEYIITLVTSSITTPPYLT